LRSCGVITLVFIDADTLIDDIFIAMFSLRLRNYREAKEWVVNENLFEHYERFKVYTLQLADMVVSIHKH